MNFTNIDCVKEEIYYHEHEVAKWQLRCQIYLVPNEVWKQIIPMENTIRQMRNTILPIQIKIKEEINK